MIVGLIPARSGSERIADKNIRELGGYPLLAYSIASALESGIFEKVIVSTDSTKYAEIAREYGAHAIMRPERYAFATSPDFQWVEYTMSELRNHASGGPDSYAILRPTSPFRTADTIRRCFEEWNKTYDSIRAVEPVKQHPGKQWTMRGDTLYPLLPFGPTDPPWHSTPLKNLPLVYAQNASLEMANTETLWKTKTISGWRIQGFLTEEWEGYDINDEQDWAVAELAIKRGLATLPEVK